MAIVTTATNRTARLFWSGDAAVTVTDEALARIQPKATDDAPPEAELAAKPAVRPRMFVPAALCTVTADATSFDVRALSYLQAQEHEALTIEAQIAAVNKACLVAIDGDPTKAEQFLAAPPAELWIALFRAVGQLTWGNLPG